MKLIVAWVFGFALMGNAALFVPQALAIWRKKSGEGISLITFAGFNLLQVIAIVQGVYQHDLALILGMIASLITCGAVTVLTLKYRLVRRRGDVRG
jgi:MtN3 and saliva related transmembrane protein